MTVHVTEEGPDGSGWDFVLRTEGRYLENPGPDNYGNSKHKLFEKNRQLL